MRPAERYREVVAADPRRTPLAARLWRPPWRIAVSAWCGVTAGTVAAFEGDVDRPGAWVVAAAVGLGLYLLPLRGDRRAPIEVEVGEADLLIRQGAREERVPLSEVRGARVAAPAGAVRRSQGWGRTWGHGGRPAWDVPAPGLGLVVVERTGATPDLAVASARPSDLVDAIFARLPVQSEA